MKDLIKQQVSMLDILNKYGIEYNKKLIKCPLHNDKTASFGLHNENQSFNCFGCGARGDIFTFTMQYFNINFNDAVKKIQYDFNIGKVTLRQQYQMRDVKRQKTQLETLQDNYNNAMRNYTKLDCIIIHNKLLPDTIPSEEFIHAIKNLAYAGYLLDEAESELYMYEHRKNSDSRPAI